MLLLIAKTGLIFSNPIVILGIILLGFLCKREKIFAHALLLVLFTMIYNLYLKSVFKIPLPPHLEGFAFPSGHMHTAFVFWGWLALQYSAVWFRSLVFLALCLAGYGLVYQGFHFPIDILGSITFGTITLIIYSQLLKLKRFQTQPYLIALLLSLTSAVMLYLLPPALRHKTHIMLAFGALCGFTLGWLSGLPQRQARTPEV